MRFVARPQVLVPLWVFALSFFFSSVYVDVEGQTNHRLEQEAENRRLNIRFSGAQLISTGD